MSPLLTFDHTQRASRQSCKRQHFFRHILGIRKAAPDSPGFSFGTAFHKSSEVLDLTGDLELAMAHFRDLFNYPDDKIRTLGRARELLVAYQRFVLQKGWKFQTLSDSTMEVAFNEPLTERINYAGRCDRQFVDGSIGEWKTTYYLYNASGNPMSYLRQWWGHNSIRGYAWARKAPHVHVLGVGVYPQKQGKGGPPYPWVESLTVPIQEWETTQFIREVTEIGEELIADAERWGLTLGYEFEENQDKAFTHRLWEHFPTNTSRCYFNVNNPCQFIDLCVRDVPRGLVESYYVTDPFLPWLEEEEKGNGD